MTQTSIFSLLNNINYAELFRVTAIIIIGLLLARFLSTLAMSLLNHFQRFTYRNLVRRTVFYAIFGLFVTTALLELGFDLHVFLGAAGILTVALGFASQMSASNLISGLFLMGERAYRVGDTIVVHGVTGEVLSLDFLSIKLRTSDNTYVRIPNEVLIKTQLTNLSRFPTRRLDIIIGVAYKEEFSHVREILLTMIKQNRLALSDPAPQIALIEFGESAMKVRLAIWVKTEHFKELKAAIHEEIKQSFDKNKIEIPFPHQVLVTKTEE